MTPCRFCKAPLDTVFADLGATPLANGYLPPTDEAIATERSWPLKVMVCDACRLVQTTETIDAGAIFHHDYAYLSSYSKSWVAHAKRYAEAMIERFALDADSLVMEIASNDGYLLQHFAARAIPVLGVEPAGHAAELAVAKGVPTEVAFFDLDTAKRLRARGYSADLIAANNVLAHVPDIQNFVAGLPVVLKPAGIVTFEFPHLLRLMEGAQFDTIYHEHYSYLSLLFVERLLRAVGLAVFDVEQLATHGGSLRVYAGMAGSNFPETERLALVRTQELQAGLDTAEPYLAFGTRIREICAGFQAFLASAHAEGKRVAAYGAAAKGNTFLNVCGVSRDQIDFVVDRNPEKQNKLLPGSHIPVLDPSQLYERKPDFVVILPWNLAAEISGEHAAISAWGGRFLTAVPEVTLL